MSIEDPFKGNNNIEGRNPESVEVPASKAAFADWCAMNEVAQKELPIDLPLNEKVALYDLVFRAGTENFLKNFAAQAEGRIDLALLKSELETLRGQGNRAAIGAKEQEIASIFQMAVSSYAYEGTTNHPRDILAKKEMNCVGASLIGGALLESVGIRTVQAGAGSHCFLIMVTSDDKVFWQDMQDGKEVPELFNQELTDEKLKGIDAATTVHASDIATFAHNPEGRMTFRVDVGRWKDDLVTIKPFLSGMEGQELINTGFVLANAGKHAEALEILEVAKQKAPDEADVYLGLAKALRGLKRYEGAIESCKKALELDPTYTYAQKEMDEIASSVPTRL